MSQFNRRGLLSALTLGAAGLRQGQSLSAFENDRSPKGPKRGSSGSIYIHPWDITEEGTDCCFNYLSDVCGLNELFLAAVYHANTFLLPHNPKRMIRWDEGAAFFQPRHLRWRESNVKPVCGEGVNTEAYLRDIVNNARKRGWGILFFAVFHFSHSLARKYPDCTMVDAMGERNRSCLCPANPDVRAYDLAVVEELMDIYGGDGIRFESLGYGRWDEGTIVNKVEVKPSARDQYLLSLCFCKSCCQAAQRADFDVKEFRRQVVAHLYRSLPLSPREWDTREVDEEWCRNAFDGTLWRYMEIRFNTVTRLYWEVQRIVHRYQGALMPFGLNQERNLMNTVDYSKFYPYLKRVSLAPRGRDLQEIKKSLREQVEKVPEWAEPEIFHSQLSYDSREALQRIVMTT